QDLTYSWAHSVCLKLLLLFCSLSGSQQWVSNSCAETLCREGWVSFQSKCYLMSTSTVTWSKAESLCQSVRGHLLVLNSVEELDFISNVAEARYSYWIGLVEHEEGHWTWVDGTDFNTTPTYWDEGQPDDWSLRVNGEDCGQLHPSYRNQRKLWNDLEKTMWFFFAKKFSLVTLRRRQRSSTLIHSC
uniref:Asialoglycoprotein receptor-like 1 n=1 Tax=Echeneis naucrates TaxID=173247 RepID=A0A665TLM7_ECHNA